MSQTMKIYVGLPASGKTSHALANRKENEVIISRDDIRYANYGVHWSKDIDENLITRIQRQQMITALEHGMSIKIVDTNLNKTNVQRMVDLASQFGAEVDYVYFELPPATCIEYDKHRDKKVGAKVINRMAKKAGINDKGWIPKHEYYYHKIKPYVNNPELPNAVIIDIDGTIAIKSDRSPYDYSRVFEDEVSENVAKVIHWINGYRATDNVDVPKIIFLSGRSSDCREQTERWLEEKFWDEDEEIELFMRPSEDPNTADFIVKDRLFDENIADNYNVIGVFDDRRQVVQCWRTKGLTVLDVAGNKF